MTRARTWLWLLIAAAVVIRIAAGLPRGAEGLRHDGYEFYATISENFLDGHGLCYSPEGGCAARMPVYPLWLALFLATGTLFPGVIIAQAALGGGLTWIAWRLGRDLFDARVGVMAAIATAFNPYAVIHDTALQDTVFINVLIPLALLWLIQARKTASAIAWLGAGAALALAVLTNARIALFVPAALAWVVYAAGIGWQSRLRAAALVSLPVIVLVGGWMVRNWRVAGAPVLTTEAGERLWFANNARTFANFPERSIDLTADELDAIVPADRRALLDHYPGTEPERDALVRGWAIDYMKEDPRRTAANALRKVWVAASAQLSPARGWPVQAGYAMVFLPVHILAIISLLRMSRRSVDHVLTWALLGSFALTTALFWAHTSHKSYLDAVLFVYAAAALVSIFPARVTAGAGA
jgi:4-amino-4-deoxy-L-arabinose transferase-like glycosyltransferase